MPDFAQYFQEASAWILLVVVFVALLIFIVAGRGINAFVNFILTIAQSQIPTVGGILLILIVAILLFARDQKLLG